MKLLKVKITPHSSFVTFAKGDTIFGHFAYHTFIEDESIFENYTKEKPKIIFSDILPDGHLYKPTLPLTDFQVDESEKKEFDKREWISIEDLQKSIKVIDKKSFSPYKKLNFYKTDIRVRNSINRVSFSTDDAGVFAPYSIEEMTFLHQPVIYVLYDEPFDEETILKRLNLIGQVGFGKKGSIGKGHFTAEVDKDFKGFSDIESEYYMTLSPTLLHDQKGVIESASYNTFNRFGKYHSSGQPFKKSLLMADSGAVVKLKTPKTYIGKAIDNGINKKSFVQAYSIVVPFEFKGALDG